MDLKTEPAARNSVSHLALKWQRPEILEAIFDQLSDGLFIYDKGLHIVGVNQSAQRLFGMSADEMIGKHCQELFHCTVCEPSCGMLQGLGSSASLPTGTVNLHIDNGRERMVVIRTVQLLDQAGALEGVVATVKDITEEAEPARRQIIAESQAMRDVLNFVRRVAISEAASILIEGENGTGKDLIAKTLHYQSLRQSEPFLAINCAAIPETLLESELFGYEKGAFTDARAQKRGPLRAGRQGHAACWTRSARCRCRCRPSCCACWKTSASGGWAGCATSPSISGSSPPPTRICARRCAKELSGRTFTIG